MKEFVFVSDAFVEQYNGGAELTTEAILRFGPPGRRIAKINCQILTVDILNSHKDSHYIVCNFAGLSDTIKIHMCKNISYSVIEYDYKFCQYRSMKKHRAATGTECDCIEQLTGKINSAFYSYAKKVWFMSAAQRDIFLSKISTLKKEKTEILSSVFAPGDLNFMESIKDNEKNDKYLILGSKSWIKGTEDCIKYAKNNGLSYEVVSGMPYHELLIKMSVSKGLIFLPLGYDTCPRFVIEAKLLGCDMILNEHVQHKEENWFTSQQSCYDYMRARGGVFWKHYA